MAPADPFIAFQPLREADSSRLCEWLNRAHVMEWWAGDDARPDIDATRKKYLPRTDETSNVKPYIALLANEPIGFIQSYAALGCGDGWWEEETDPGVVGIDQFLCDGPRLGQGLGTRMVKAFVELLLAQPQLTKIQTDPDPSNPRAIRCYEKVGFRRVREIVTPDGPALLMVMEKAKPNEHTNATSR